MGYDNKSTKSQEYLINNYKAQSLLNIINITSNNKKRDYPSQVKALIGIALHILQDSFAHLSRIKVYENGITLLKQNGEDTITSTFFSNTFLHSTKSFEDKVDILEWRYNNAKDITKKLRKAYLASKKINGFKTIKYDNKKALYFWTRNSWYYIKYQEYRLKIV